MEYDFPLRSIGDVESDGSRRRDHRRRTRYGATFTLAFLAAGANVVSTDRSWTGAEPLDGKNVLVADMDVTRDADIDRVYAATLERFGTVDVLINNAACVNAISSRPTAA